MSTPQNPYTTKTYNDDYTKYEYAGFWIRVVANIVDNLLIFIVVFLVGMILGVLGIFNPQNFNSSANFTLWELLINLSIAVFVIVCWIKYAGTPAKRLFGLKVLNATTGERLSVGQAIIRYLGYILAAVFLLLGFIWVAFDKRKQGWHDKLANSVVVKEIR